MASATHPLATFVCATCHRTTEERLAVDYKPHRGAPIRICAMCESALIGYGEEAGMEMLRRSAEERDTHMVQSGILSVLTSDGGRIDLTADDLRALAG